MVRLPDGLPLHVEAVTPGHQRRLVSCLAVGEPALQRTVIVIEHGEDQRRISAETVVPVADLQLAVIGQRRHYARRGLPLRHGRQFALRLARPFQKQVERLALFRGPVLPERDQPRTECHLGQVRVNLRVGRLLSASLGTINFLAQFRQGLFGFGTQRTHHGFGFPEEKIGVRLFLRFGWLHAETHIGHDQGLVLSEPQI